MEGLVKGLTVILQLPVINLQSVTCLSGALATYIFNMCFTCITVIRFESLLSILQIIGSYVHYVTAFSDSILIFVCNDMYILRACSCDVC